MPSLREQSRRAGRSLFHLNGSSAARHAETLAEGPAITAVQCVPGAATPSARAKLEMFQMLQKAGKPLWLYCPSSEIQTPCEKLDSHGLALAPTDVRCPQEAAHLLRMVESYHA